jgi:hypothetical protein
VDRARGGRSVLKINNVTKKTYEYMIAATESYKKTEFLRQLGRSVLKINNVTKKTYDGSN